MMTTWEQRPRIRGASDREGQSSTVLEPVDEARGDDRGSHEEGRWPRSVEPNPQGRGDQEVDAVHANMTSHYPIVLEHEQNGTVSAYVVGLPGVIAAADTERAATAAIRKALAAHLAAVQALPVKVRQVRTTLRVARITTSLNRLNFQQLTQVRVNMRSTHRHARSWFKRSRGEPKRHHPRHRRATNLE